MTLDDMESRTGGAWVQSLQSSCVTERHPMIRTTPNQAMQPTADRCGAASCRRMIHSILTPFFETRM